MPRRRNYVLLFVACLSVGSVLLVVVTIAGMGIDSVVDTEFKEMIGSPPINTINTTFRNGEPSEIFVEIEAAQSAEQLFSLGFFEGFVPRRDIDFNSQLSGPPSLLAADRALWQRPGGEIRVLHAEDSGDGNWQLSWHPSDPDPTLLFLDNRVIDQLSPLLPESRFIGVNFRVSQLAFSVWMNRLAIDSVTLWYDHRPSGSELGEHETLTTGRPTNR